MEQDEQQSLLLSKSKAPEPPGMPSLSLPKAYIREIFDKSSINPWYFIVLSNQSEAQPIPINIITSNPSSRTVQQCISIQPSWNL